MIPNHDQFRGIAVGCPFTRIIESTYLEPLEKYLTERLHRRQIGYVKGQGVEVLHALFNY